jgi:DNA replication and repair protein RecF
MVLAVGSSYRAKDQDLVQFNQAWARLDAHTQAGQRTVLLEANEGGVSKRFIMDGQKLSRLSHQKMLPYVLFEPNHLVLLHGAPELRRGYLDDVLERIVTGYKHLRLRYRRTLSQRNALLKQGYGAAKSQLFAWNLRLSELGEQMVSYRVQLVEDINKQLVNVYSELAHSKSHVAARYHSQVSSKSYGSQLLKKLEAHNELDCQRGFTAYGPHRDDLVIELQGEPIQVTASRGEMRTLVLALKIIELKLLEEAYSQTPLLLLDDVFSELDGARRQALTSHLQPYQTFITTTDADVVMKHFASSSNLIALSKT